MPNHVHIIIVPSDKDGLRRTFADAHRRYTGYINTRMRTTGHLWQGRFGSVVMDEKHLAHAVRYVSLNPVRANLVKQAEDWPWSSLRCHLLGQENNLVNPKPILDRYKNFSAFLNQVGDAESLKALRLSETTGRPLGDEHWLKNIEKLSGLKLTAQKRGTKKQ